MNKIYAQILVKEASNLDYICPIVPPQFQPTMLGLAPSSVVP
jgi:hypothetical protein